MPSSILGKRIHFLLCKRIHFLVACFFITQVLSDWINDVLQDMRIVVRDIAEDLYDGHILALFVGE